VAIVEGAFPAEEVKANDRLMAIHEDENDQGLTEHGMLCAGVAHLNRIEGDIISIVV
jgi:hypothetical protein